MFFDSLMTIDFFLSKSKEDRDKPEFSILRSTTKDVNRASVLLTGYRPDFK